MPLGDGHGRCRVRALARREQREGIVHDRCLLDAEALPVLRAITRGAPPRLLERFALAPALLGLRLVLRRIEAVE